MGHGVLWSCWELGAHLPPPPRHGAVLYSARLLSCPQTSHRPALQLVCLNLAEELSKKGWSEPPGADGGGEEKPQKQKRVLGACETPLNCPLPVLALLGLDIGKRNFTRMQTRARHSRVPACRGLGIEDLMAKMPTARYTAAWTGE